MFHDVRFRIPWLVAIATSLVVATANAGPGGGVTGTECELVDNADWNANGYDPGALDTWRVYITFDDPSDQLLAVFGLLARC